MSKIGARMNCSEARAYVRFAGSVQPTSDGDRIASEIDGIIHLTLTRDAGTRLAAALRTLGPEGTCVLVTTPAPEVDVRLVWQPGQDAIQTITSAASDAHAATGGMVVVVFGPTMSNGARVLEDGFAVVLNADSWNRLLDSFQRGTALRIASEEQGQQSFDLRFRD